MGVLICCFSLQVLHKPHQEAALAGNRVGLKKEDPFMKGQASNGKKLGQVAIQEMTHVSLGPLRLLGNRH